MGHGECRASPLGPAEYLGRAGNGRDGVVGKGGGRGWKGWNDGGGRDGLPGIE